MLRPTPGDPWGVEQHHWNTGAKENQQLNPGGPSRFQKNETVSCHNERIRWLAAEYSFVVSLASVSVRLNIECSYCSESQEAEVAQELV